MRIVSIAAINGVPQYDDHGGIGDFGQTVVVGSNCIGEYNGAIGEGTLPTYTGTNPLDRYETVLSKTDFKTLFTATEYRAISNLAGTDNNAYQFWDMAQTADRIDMNDDRTTAGLSYVSGMGAITGPRLAVILLGKAIV
jgi:hypothetical protein